MDGNCPGFSAHSCRVSHSESSRRSECGGAALETGIGRAPTLALASLPGFVLPGDTSASDRYYETDLTAPFVIHDGHQRVPTGPGIGVDVLPDVLEQFTTSMATLPLE